jgi:hypothetical protein
VAGSVAAAAGAVAEAGLLGPQPRPRRLGVIIDRLVEGEAEARAPIHHAFEHRAHLPGLVAQIIMHVRCDHDVLLPRLLPGAYPSLLERREGTLHHRVEGRGARVARIHRERATHPRRKGAAPVRLQCSEP